MQRQAVEATDGALLIIAGAGAGKTRVITHRIAHLIEKGVEPERILAVTFTNKASAEMRDRVLALMPENLRSTSRVPFVSTFHTLGVYILKEHAKLVDRTRWFAILDKGESLSLIKRCLKQKGLDPKQFEPRKFQGIISREKGNLVTRTKYAERGSDHFLSETVASVWEEYDKQLLAQNAFDFDDLLLQTVLLLQENEVIRNMYQQRWTYVHVDEYQDTNAVQYELSRILAAGHKNICVVGDMDQNIYSWRGANIRNILNFEKDFAPVTSILLEENYRSTQTILGAANEIIKKNKLRKEKNLFTKNKEGERIEVIESIDELDEAAQVIGAAKGLIQEGTPANDIAILYRANFQSRVLEEECIRQTVAHQVLGTGFFERREVKEMLAFIKGALNREDRESLARIINIPKRGIGEKTLEKIFARETQTLPPRLQEEYAIFLRLLDKIKIKIETVVPSEVIRFIFESSGIKAHYEAEEEEGEERLLNIGELLSLSKKYDPLGPLDGIEKLLEESSLASDQDSLLKNKNGIKLLTVHASKGLEFKYVFIVGLEQDLFPHSNMDGADSDRTEEERRLFYVALTRAQEKVFLSHASSRAIFGSRRVNIPSEFLADIPEDLRSEKNPYRSTTGGTNFLGNIIDF